MSVTVDFDAVSSEPYHCVSSELVSVSSRDSSEYPRQPVDGLASHKPC
jgi:hypothetical protein